jgi:hypothetical protein
MAQTVFPLQLKWAEPNVNYFTQLKVFFDKHGIDPCWRTIKGHTRFSGTGPVDCGFPQLLLSR